ncbi:MAG: hypothetical protein M3083_19875 [Actinomycetota bacterium]|nr:hypothetical protein [Actinomycetota bacterium]
MEGSDGPFAGQKLEEVATCQWDQTVAEARAVLAGSTARRDHGHRDHEHSDHGDHDHEHSGHGDGGHGDGRHDPSGGHPGRLTLAPSAAIVLGPAGLAVGAIDDDALAAAADSDLVLDVMDPVPTTVRPSVTVASLLESEDRTLITSSDGRLLGQVVGGDPEEGDETEGYDEEVAKILAEVRERFGSDDPSEEQLRAFLHDRLVAQGRTAEEADQFLAEMDEPEPD